MQIIKSMGKISYLVDWIVARSEGPIQRRPSRRAVVFTRHSIRHCSKKEEYNGKRGEEKRKVEEGEDIKMAGFENDQRAPKKSRTKHIPII
jgi:hypothetical protein